MSLLYKLMFLLTIVSAMMYHVITSPIDNHVSEKLEEKECGPTVQVSENVTMRGKCLQSVGADCDCFVEQRCPSAVEDCREEVIISYCCCYRFITPPGECFMDDVKENSYSTVDHGSTASTQKN